MEFSPGMCCADLEPLCDYERAHLGCNWVDNVIELTANEPTYWSALTGMPKGTSPFTVLDPGFPPGRWDPLTGDRVLRGFIIAYAVDEDGEEIHFNHLKGDALIVNLLDKFDHVRLFRGGHTRQRLVQQKQFGFTGQRNGNPKGTLVTMR